MYYLHVTSYYYLVCVPFQGLIRRWQPHQIEISDFLDFSCFTVSINVDPVSKTGFSGHCLSRYIPNNNSVLSLNVTENEVGQKYGSHGNTVTISCFYHHGI